TAIAITPRFRTEIRRPETADASKRSKNTGFLLKFEPAARHRDQRKIAQTARNALEADVFAEHPYGDQNIANVLTFAACAEILVRCKSSVSSLYAAQRPLQKTENLPEGNHEDLPCPVQSVFATEANPDSATNFQSEFLTANAREPEP